MEYPIDYFIECPIACHLEYPVVDYLTRKPFYVRRLMYTLNIPHDRLSSRNLLSYPLDIL